MVKKVFVLAACAAGLVAASSLPASAQFADFFCDTFTIGCRAPEPPPPPPPAPAPVEEAAPVKKVKHVRKKPVMKKAAPAAAAPADAPAAK